jgi:hypothetical protein
VDKNRQGLINYWINRLKNAQREEQTEFDYQKDLMTDELDYDECEIVFNSLD